MGFRVFGMVLWRLDKRKETLANEKGLEKPRAWGAAYVAGCDPAGCEVRSVSHRDICFCLFNSLDRSFDFDGFNLLLCNGLFLSDK